MKYLLLLSICVIVFISCNEPKEQTHHQTKATIPQTTLPTIIIKKPIELIAIDSTFGDLDNDTFEEKVIVFHNQSSEENTKSEIRIYKQQNQNWKLFYVSKKGIWNVKRYSFDKVVIEKGILKIYHTTISSFHVSLTHKYRYQNNDFDLIGYTDYSGILCQEWTKFDYNLSTGKINYQKETENCNHETNEHISKIVEQETFYHKLDTLPKLSTFEFWEREFRSPKYEAVLIF